MAGLLDSAAPAKEADYTPKDGDCRGASPGTEGVETAAFRPSRNASYGFSATAGRTSVSRRPCMTWRAFSAALSAVRPQITDAARPVCGLGLRPCERRKAAQATPSCTEARCTPAASAIAARVVSVVGPAQAIARPTPLHMSAWR